VLLALDLFHRLDPAIDRRMDGRAAHLRVETADGRDLAGFAACRWLAARLPLLWPLVPVLALPGAGRLYRWADRFLHQRASVTHATTPVAAMNGPTMSSAVDSRIVSLPARADATAGEPGNAVAAFLAEQCIVSRPAMTSAEALFDAYSGWARTNGERLLSQRELGLALTEQGLTRRRHGKANRWHWAGVRLVTAADRQRASPTETNRSERDLAQPPASPDTAGQAPLVGSPGFAVAHQQAGG
jgi:hypothetical protein